MMRMNHILQIAELSETEGVFTTAQAARAGIPRDALSYGEKAGRIVRVIRGAYRLAGTRSTEIDELSAIWKLTAPALFTYERAQANGWDGFVVGGASAASLLGLGDFYFSPYQLYAPQSLTRGFRKRTLACDTCFGRVWIVPASSNFFPTETCPRRGPTCT